MRLTRSLTQCLGDKRMGKDHPITRVECATIQKKAERYDVDRVVVVRGDGDDALSSAMEELQCGQADMDALRQVLSVAAERSTSFEPSDQPKGVRRTIGA